VLQFMLSSVLYYKLLALCIPFIVVVVVRDVVCSGVLDIFNWKISQIAKVNKVQDLCAIVFILLLYAVVVEVLFSIKEVTPGRSRFFLASHEAQAPLLEAPPPLIEDHWVAPPSILILRLSIPVPKLFHAAIQITKTSLVVKAIHHFQEPLRRKYHRTGQSTAVFVAHRIYWALG